MSPARSLTRWQWLRRWLAAALLAGLALPDAAGAGDLRLAVSRGPVSLPLYVADAKGYFSAEGLGVRLMECHSGRQCFTQLEEGQADLATAAELVVALDSLRSSNATIIATLSSSAQQIKLVARRSAGIAVPADLRGKRVGTVARTSAQFYLDSWLLYHQVEADDVQVVALGVDQLVDALGARRVDAVAIWQPIAAQAQARLGVDLAELPSPRVYNQHFVLVVGRALLAAREADVLRLLRALLRAEQLIAERPAEAAGILASRLQLDLALARIALGEHEYRLSLTPALLSTMDSQARWAIRERLVEPGQRVGTLLGAVDPAPLRKVAPQAVSLPTP